MAHRHSLALLFGPTTRHCSSSTYTLLRPLLRPPSSTLAPTLVNLLYVLGFGANFTKSTSYPLGWVTWPRLGPTLVISPPQVPNPAPTLVNPPSLTLVSAPTLLPWALACHHPLLGSVDDDDDNLQSFELDTTGRSRQNDSVEKSSAKLELVPDSHSSARGLGVE